MKCRNCKKEYFIHSLECPYCGFNQTQEVSQEYDDSTHEEIKDEEGIQYEVQKRPKKRANTGVIIGTIVGCFIIIAALIIAVIVPQYTLKNQRALEFYDKANDILYQKNEDGIMYNASNALKPITEAEDVSKSRFVPKETKQKINNLSSLIYSYILLHDTQSAIFDGKYPEAKSFITRITLSEVKENPVYKECSHKIELNRLREINRQENEKMLEELMNEEYDEIKKSRLRSNDNPFGYNHVKGICGVASIGDSYVANGFELFLTTYDNVVYTLEFKYSDSEFPEDSDWNIFIDKLYNLVKTQEEYEIAIIGGSYNDIKYFPIFCKIGSRVRLKN